MALAPGSAAFRLLRRRGRRLSFAGSLPCQKRDRGQFSDRRFCAIRQGGHLCADKTGFLDAQKAESFWRRGGQMDASQGAGPATGVSRPDASRPGVSRPDASRPDASRPDASRPDASRPDASRRPGFLRPAEFDPKLSALKPAKNAAAPAGGGNFARRLSRGLGARRTPRLDAGWRQAQESRTVPGDSAAGPRFRPRTKASRQAFLSARPARPARPADRPQAVRRPAAGAA
jgi:hypothetical protein